MDVKETVKNFSVLLIETSNEESARFRKYLSEIPGTCFKIERCPDISDSLLVLKDNSFDIILLDISGQEENLHNHLIMQLADSYSEIPVIVITAEEDEKSGLEAINYGAQDYLVKNRFDAAALRKSIRFAIERINYLIRFNDSLKLHEETFEQAAVGLSQLSAEGKYLKANKKFCEILGYSREEILDKSIEDVTHPDDLEEDLILLEEIIKGKIHSYNVEKRYIRKDGTTVWVHLTRTGISHNRKENQYFFTTIEDITERKRLETALQNLLQEKELLIKESHHRIKNNLQLVSSLLNFSLSSVRNSEVENLIADSKNRIKIISTVHEYLYKSSAHNNVDIQNYLYNFLDYIRGGLGTSVHKIKIIKDVDSCMVKSDLAVSIGLIVNELLTNSVKYAFPGNKEGVLVVELKQSGDSINLTVKDNGIGLNSGINPEDAKSLGFQIVNSLVAQHNGTMRYSVDKGTRFNIKLKMK